MPSTSKPLDGKSPPPPSGRRPRFAFNRMEAAGALGDLGTLLPLAVGLIMINGLRPEGVLFSVGLTYILTGFYYGLPTPVQPMKVISAYAVATALPANQIAASGLLMAVLLLVIGAAGIMTAVGRYIPKPVIRGVQLATGVKLMAAGVSFMAGTSGFQQTQGAAEPFFRIQEIGGLPLWPLAGALAVLLTLRFLKSERMPSGLLVIGIGLTTGLLLGDSAARLRPETVFSFPSLLPYGWPPAGDFMIVWITLVLPQLPMTLGNAVVANSDLAGNYFDAGGKRVTYRRLCLSMSAANFLAFAFGGMPLCHGAGGLAAMHRFGARTGGANLMIGGVFLLVALVWGASSIHLLTLLPLAVLGALLLFSGGQLAMQILDMTRPNDLFVALVMLGISQSIGLAAGFLAGLILERLLARPEWSV